MRELRVRGSSARPWTAAALLLGAGLLVGCSVGGGDGEGAPSQKDDSGAGANPGGADGAIRDEDSVLGPLNPGSSSTGSGNAGDPGPSAAGEGTMDASGGEDRESASGEGAAGSTAEADAGEADATPADAGSDASVSQCVVAVRLDRCCGEFVAASAAELAADDCLVAWQDRNADPALSNDCLARSPVDCAAVQCAVPVRPSSRAEPDASGRCVFVADCERDDDCVRAFDARTCCDCGSGVPREQVESDACLWTAEQTPPPAEACPNQCPGVLCGACPEPQPVRCEVAPGVDVRACR